MKKEINVCWLRRDLRLTDNTALFHALKGSYPVLPVFIFDPGNTGKLPSKKDRRVAFIWQVLEQIHKELKKNGSSIFVLHEMPLNAFEKLCNRFDIKGVFVNHDYQPYAIERDDAIKKYLASKNIPFHTYKDQVIFEGSEILKADGKPYTVFTPYAKAWKQTFVIQQPQLLRVEEYFSNLLKTPSFPLPALEEVGFENTATLNPCPTINETVIRNYHETRNLPAIDGTSRLSTHLCFGTISVRNAVAMASRLNEQWLNELIWREFFMMILFYFPDVVQHSFKRKYDRIPWRNNEQEFELWCKGETGYPIVDAGMRQLNETGWMHNRVRMIVASFLTKHLLIDWRWGEAYFAEKLLDYELSSNNGNWQWAAGSGCDAAPYFRIFNPVIQQKKFDPDLKYVRTWIKDFHPGRLTPIVEHGFARKRALEVYKNSLA